MLQRSILFCLQNITVCSKVFIVDQKKKLYGQNYIVTYKIISLLWQIMAFTYMPLTFPDIA
jgi:hypothetical protein